MRRSRYAFVIAVAIAATAAGCDDLLDVQDPSRFTDDDLDQALDAVANGAEGDLHVVFDDLVYSSALLGDEFQHTGTWAQWDDIDHGRIRYDQSTTADAVMNAILRARFAARDAVRRFDRIRADGDDVPEALYAQVRTAAAWANLLLAQHYCEAPAEPGGAALSDVEMFTVAVTDFDQAVGSAQTSGATEFENWARAGRARAHLMLGNLDAAEADAQAVPDGWEYTAKFTQGNFENAVVNLATVGFNNAGGIRQKWWARVDVDARALLDAFSGEADPRVGIRRDAGVLGVDGITDFYSQWKYRDVASDIAFTHSSEMRLIQAEVAWRRGELSSAMGLLNDLRAAAGLSAVTATTPDEVRDVLLNERFAELFMEAQRANDLQRFGLSQEFFASGDFVASVADRAVKFPLTSSEAINNPNIDDDVNERCSPTL